jgi:hypothetical protein
MKPPTMGGMVSRVARLSAYVLIIVFTLTTGWIGPKWFRYLGHRPTEVEPLKWQESVTVVSTEASVDAIGVRVVTITGGTSLIQVNANFRNGSPRATGLLYVTALGRLAGAVVECNAGHRPPSLAKVPLSVTALSDTAASGALPGLPPRDKYPSSVLRIEIDNRYPLDVICQLRYTTWTSDNGVYRLDTPSVSLSLGPDREGVIRCTATDVYLRPGDEVRYASSGSMDVFQDSRPYDDTFEIASTSIHERAGLSGDRLSWGRCSRPDTRDGRGASTVPPRVHVENILEVSNASRDLFLGGVIAGLLGAVLLEMVVLLIELAGPASRWLRGLRARRRREPIPGP